MARRRKSDRKDSSGSAGGHRVTAAAARGLEKLRRGQRPTAAEQRAVEEEVQWKALTRAIPQKFLRALCGRQTKQINEQADRYGAPIGGPEFDLAAFFRWFFAFLAENARKLAIVPGDDPMSGPSTPALERWRIAKAILAELTVDQRKENLLARAKVHEGLARFAGILRAAGEALGRQYGSDAQAVLDEALDDCQRVIGELVGDERSD